MRALVGKGVMLGELGRREEAIAVYDDIVGRFGAASETALREGVARALVNKGSALGELGRREEAIAVYDDVVGRFGTASEPTLREVIDRATKLRASLNPETKKSKRKKRN
jgi:tetratricopeptide (TPR) repeat protein